MNASIGSGYAGPRFVRLTTASAAPSSLSQQVAALSKTAAAPGRSGKSPGQLAAERELAMGNKQISEGTRAILREEARVRVVQRRTAQTQANVENWERKYQKASPDIKEYIEKKGLLPTVEQTPLGPILKVKADIGNLERDATIKALKTKLKNEGWSKFYSPPSGFGAASGRNNEIWVQRDANGNPITWAKWDELSTPASRQEARAPYVQAAALRQAAEESVKEATAVSSPIGDEIVYGMSGFETMGHMGDAPEEGVAVKAMEQKTIPGPVVTKAAWWQRMLPLVGIGLGIWVVARIIKSSSKK